MDVIENSFIQLKITDEFNEPSQAQMNELNGSLEVKDELTENIIKLVDVRASPLLPNAKTRQKINKTDEKADLDNKSNIQKAAPVYLLPIYKATNFSPENTTNRNVLAKSKQRKIVEPMLNSLKKYPSKVNYKQSVGGDIELFDEKKSYFSKFKNDTTNKPAKYSGDFEKSKTIFNEKPSYDVSSKVDSYNINYKKALNSIETITKKNTFEDSLVFNAMKQSSGKNRAIFNKPGVGYQQTANNQLKKNKLDIFAEVLPTSSVSDRELNLKNSSNYNNNQYNWREKGKAIYKRAQSTANSEKLKALKFVKKEEKAVNNKRNAKLIDELGFIEPNIKNVKSKINSMWVTQENLAAGNNQLTPRKPRKVNTDNLKDREEALSPKTKVKNWLVTSKPGSPVSTDENPPEVISKANASPATNHQKFPTIKKSNFDLNQIPNTNTINKFKKNPWLVDVPHEVFNQPKIYDSKLPQLHPRVIYELVNSLTNRKPVKVNENSYLFGLTDEDMNLNLNKYEEKVYSSNANKNSSKVLESNENLESKNLVKHRKFFVHINQPKGKTPYEKKLDEKLEDEMLETEIEIVNESSAAKKQTDQIIYHSLPLELKIGQIPNQDTDNETFYILKPKMPVVANNLIQYHVSQSGRQDNGQVSFHPNTIKPVLAINPVSQMQPVIYYQNAFPNILQNSVPNILQNSVPNILQNSLPTILQNNLPNILQTNFPNLIQNSLPSNLAASLIGMPVGQPSVQYIPYPYQMTPQTTTLPSQYVLYNPSQVQQQPLLRPQLVQMASNPNLQRQQSLRDIPLSERQYLAMKQQKNPFVSNSLVRTKNFNNLNASNHESQSYKITKSTQPEYFLESNDGKNLNKSQSSNQPGLIESLSLSKNKRLVEESHLSLLANRQKNSKTIDQPIKQIDRYKDLIYKPRHLTSINKDSTQKMDIFLKEQEHQSLDEMEEIQSTSNFISLIPSTTSRENTNSILLSSRGPVLLDNLKLPIPREEINIEEIVVAPRLMNELKLPIGRLTREITSDPPAFPSHEQIKIETPDSIKQITPRPSPVPTPILKESTHVVSREKTLELSKEIVFKPLPKIQKDYHGKFHYPPEVEQQVEEDKDENENVSNQIKEENIEANFEEIEKFYDTSNSLFVNRPKSCQIESTIVREMSDMSEHIQINSPNIIDLALVDKKDAIEAIHANDPQLRVKERVHVNSKVISEHHLSENTTPIPELQRKLSSINSTIYEVNDSYSNSQLNETKEVFRSYDYIENVRKSSEIEFFNDSFNNNSQTTNFMEVDSFDLNAIAQSNALECVENIKNDSEDLILDTPKEILLVENASENENKEQLESHEVLLVSELKDKVQQDNNKVISELNNKFQLEINEIANELNDKAQLDLNQTEKVDDIQPGSICESVENDEIEKESNNDENDKKKQEKNAVEIEQPETVYDEAKEAPELTRIKSNHTIGRIHSGSRKLSVNERANFNSLQVEENIESEEVPMESRPARPVSRRLAENIEKADENELLKAITKNPPMVALAPELQTEPEELIEHNNHDENDVNIYLHEASIKMLTPRPRPRKIVFHGGGRNCCSAHRRNDPYNHIASKVQSFENFSYQPTHTAFQIFNTKPNWVAESKVSKLSNENINFSLPQSQISIFNEKLKWKPRPRVRSLSIDHIFNSEKTYPERPFRLRAMSQLDLTMDQKQRILVFHSLPKWNEIVSAKVNSFENFHYRPNGSNYKIYNEKVKWNSESKIKPIIYSGNNYIPETQMPNYKLKFNTLPKIDTHSLHFERRLEDDENQLLYKFPPIRSDWYPGHKIDTFNILFRSFDNKLAEKMKWRSEPVLRVDDYPQYPQLSKTPVYTEKLKWKSESKLKNISWENFHYKYDSLLNSQRKTKKNSQAVYAETIQKKLPKLKSIPNKINSWNRGYLKFRKQDENERQKIIEQARIKAIKAIRAKLRAEQPDTERISNMQSYSRFRELPPIKSANNGNQTDRSDFSFEPYILRPNWNPNPNYPHNSLNRLLNPDVRDVHLKRYQWDHELKRRSVADQSSLSRFDSESMNLNSSIEFKHKKDDGHLYGTEPLNDLKSRITSPHRISTGKSGRYSNRNFPETPSTKFAMSTSQTPIDSITPRIIKKRSIKEEDRKSIMMKEHDMKYPKFQPDIDGFEIQGNTLRVDTSTKVRPLNNISYKNSEETARTRATSRLYSSMTSRSHGYMGTELENLMD